MANCTDLLHEFDSTIRLTKARKDSLKISRNDLRKKIRKYFSEERPDEITPKFAGQGSMETDTAVNPIPRKEEAGGEEQTLYKYDIDDGIYFIGDDFEEERKTIQTHHNWICEAIDGHTSQKPIDKNTCVRVVFADGHHIDLPIYYKKEDTPELAHKAKGWVYSDPKEFIEWFKAQIGKKQQLIRLIRYLKAWCDYREFSNSSIKMPSGFIMTILAVNNYYRHKRDDIALKETLVNIQAELSREFKCERPTTPAGEDLFEEYSHEGYFMNVLAHFIEQAQHALREGNQMEACKYWQKIFGNRFSCSNAQDEDEKKHTGALAIGAASSNPWAS
ncbi:hypothetical protein SAMN05443144_13213 [Fodinibius roseus]|uniref:Cyclic GMP-AMP synthase n=1 Tax=Fodinibius roseus TaxID=1194090 RepID=A0A1M5KH89_9BACT|nr:hypothetical protein [Fodinibius roseus]SHG52162.1 hypothetical protein SAMN05443144_13213 [Fodinibius roseus]